MDDENIFVTQPSLPPLEEFIPYLEKIWQSKRLTNKGPFHQQLEQALCEYLGVDHISLFTNGTIALITALQALKITGEVITTPYSFVATAHSLLWNNIKPVFVDIDPATCNINPDHIEEAVTPHTTAILPVHCYGNPCDVDRIQEIANAHRLKVVYDAAHAFGVKYNGNSLLKHGDLTVLSFHATKVYNTFEGGAIVSPDAETKKHIDFLKNFGFADEVTVLESGINGKMSEFNAALGLLQLKYIDRALDLRKQIAYRYRQAFEGIKGIDMLPLPARADSNFAYFPIIVQDDFPLDRDALYLQLKVAGINTRRYFYPLISDMPMYRHFRSAVKSNLANARNISDRVICMPIYPDLKAEQVDRIVGLVSAIK